MIRRVPSYRPPTLRKKKPKSPAPPGQWKRYRQTPERKALEDFYNQPPWRRLRALYIAEHPLCEECLKQGKMTMAVQVHHKRDIIVHWDLRYDYENLQSLCIPCHNKMRI